MNIPYGVVWYKQWHCFDMYVLSVPGGFQSIVKEPWSQDAKMCDAVRQSRDIAVNRCWGMVRQECELKAAQAMTEMFKGES